MVDIIFKCDRCGSTLIYDCLTVSHGAVKIRCSGCEKTEIIDFNDYCSPRNKMFLEILAVINS